MKDGRDFSHNSQNFRNWQKERTGSCPFFPICPRPCAAFFTLSHKQAAFLLSPEIVDQLPEPLRRRGEICRKTLKAQVLRRPVSLPAGAPAKPSFRQHFGCFTGTGYDMVEMRLTGPPLRADRASGLAKYCGRWIIYLLFSSPASMQFAAHAPISWKSGEISQSWISGKVYARMASIPHPAAALKWRPSAL